MAIKSQPKKVELEYRYDFQFDREWQGRFYAIKRVSPIVAESDTEIVVITVYTFYY
ncbi:hypothetical protein CAL7716_029970 [Calothrix sp. PCC 7716]|nr:hypothetical protein CAL7716_029970 [Calothrix sp. PCC 7716]